MKWRNHLKITKKQKLLEQKKPIYIKRCPSPQDSDENPMATYEQPTRRQKAAAVVSEEDME